MAIELLGLNPGVSNLTVWPSPAVDQTASGLTRPVPLPSYSWSVPTILGAPLWRGGPEIEEQEAIRYFLYALGALIVGLITLYLVKRTETIRIRVVQGETIIARKTGRTRKGDVGWEDYSLGRRDFKKFRDETAAVENRVAETPVDLGEGDLREMGGAAVIGAIRMRRAFQVVSQRGVHLEVGDLSIKIEGWRSRQYRFAIAERIQALQESGEWYKDNRVAEMLHYLLYKATYLFEPAAVANLPVLPKRVVTVRWGDLAILEQIVSREAFRKRNGVTRVRVWTILRGRRVVGSLNYEELKRLHTVIGGKNPDVPHHGVQEVQELHQRLFG